MSDQKQRIKIVTPEGVVFSLYLAGPSTRFLAWGIDIFCVIAFGSVAGAIAGPLAIIDRDLIQAFTAIMMFLFMMGYGIVLEWLWRGQTLGKRIMKLQVMDAEALPLRLHQVVIRNLFRVVDILPALYMVGGLFALFTKKAQRLGDIAANTIVVRHMPLMDVAFAEVLSGKHNSFRDYPHLAGRLRQKVSPREAQLALEAILRRDQFTPEARVELFDNLAEHFRSLVEFPAEATFGMSSEQYIRNAVDILFDKRNRF